MSAPTSSSRHPGRSTPVQSHLQKAHVASCIETSLEAQPLAEHFLKSPPQNLPVLGTVELLLSKSHGRALRGSGASENPQALISHEWGSISVATGETPWLWGVRNVRQTPPLGPHQGACDSLPGHPNRVLSRLGQSLEKLEMERTGCRRRAGEEPSKTVWPRSQPPRSTHPNR